MDTITEVERAPKFRYLIRMFLTAGQEQARAFNRPYGTVHLLIGRALHTLHSRDGCEAGDLRLNRRIVYPG